ncbi:MAG: multiheme c-type cytochrome [Blastocatellia bacterium]
MLKRICFFFALALFTVVLAQTKEQYATPDYRNNNCVTCHAQLTTPVTVSNRYFQWHSSVHRDAGVSCEKCHGGNASTTDKAKAHTGIRPVSDPQSALHFRNIAMTCKACHQGVVNTFVESKHFQNLKTTGLGPTCSTCHEHMATEVILSPQQVGNLCVYCHNTINGALPPRPEIREKAEAVMQSLNRADVAVAWAVSLLREGEMKRRNVAVERVQVTAAQGLLKEAKLTWHTFDLAAAQKRADEAFTNAMKAKDELSKKLAH